MAKAKNRRIDGPAADDEFHLLTEETFRILADWEHFALLSLIRVRGIKHSPEVFASRLGIPPSKAKKALNRLVKVGLLVKRNGRYIRTQERLRTTDDVASRALRLSHRQNLNQACEALEQVPLELRDITSITMPIAIRKIPQAKERIKNFRRDLCALLEGEDADQVYNLNVQLVPVTRVEMSSE